MGTMRALKKELRGKLSASSWRQNIGEIANIGQPAAPVLFSFLLLEPVMRHRAAVALGSLVANLRESDPDIARNYIRQFMWRMNEDSGNIGWGIPEAFAETLAASPELAKEYASILISYIMDLGFADNFCDYSPLRRSCYWAVGRLAQAQPELVEKKREWLARGLGDEDEICRGMTAWALAQLPGRETEVSALQKLAGEKDSELCQVFDGDRMQDKSVAQLARETLMKIKDRTHGE